MGGERKRQDNTNKADEEKNNVKCGPARTREKLMLALERDFRSHIQLLKNQNNNTDGVQFD